MCNLGTSPLPNDSRGEGRTARLEVVEGQGGREFSSSWGSCSEKMLGKLSMKRAERCCGGAAEMAELRASRSKTERQRAFEPMPESLQRIPGNI